jgi:hypothetical protein
VFEKSRDPRVVPPVMCDGGKSSKGLETTGDSALERSGLKIEMNWGKLSTNM